MYMCICDYLLGFYVRAWAWETRESHEKRQVVIILNGDSRIMLERCWVFPFWVGNTGYRRGYIILQFGCRVRAWLDLACACPVLVQVQSTFGETSNSRNVWLAASFRAPSCDMHLIPECPPPPLPSPSLLKTGVRKYRSMV